MRIAISGGSLGGLFAASLLRQAGHEVRIFERSRGGLGGRGAGLVPQREVFEALDLVGRPEVTTTGVVARERITLARDGSIVQRDPHPQTQLSWNTLYDAVRATVDGADYHLGAAVAAAASDDHGAWLMLESGERIAADLVIGADGIGSAVRRSLASGTLPIPQYAGYVAWRFLIPESAVPPVAIDTLLDRFAFFHMPGGQALGYLVAGPAGETAPGRRRYNCVWYRRAPDLAAVLVDSQGRRNAFSIAPGEVPDTARERLVADAEVMLPKPFAAVVAAEPRPFVQAIFDLTTPIMVHRRVALLGDAAFVARPHTAMGVAKAAGDAMELAAALAGLPLREALAAYGRQRVSIGQAIVALGQRLGASLG